MKRCAKSGFGLSCLALSLALAGCGSKGAAPASGFDVLALMTLDFKSAQKVLGKPDEIDITKHSKDSTRVATWNDDKGNSIDIFYNLPSEKPYTIMFSIPDAEASNDALKVLKAGNLSIVDTRYTLTFLGLSQDQKKITGVMVQSLTP